jgi:hypothetical protein
MGIIIIPYRIFFHKNRDSKATNVKRQGKGLRAAEPLFPHSYTYPYNGALINKMKSSVAVDMIL